MKNFRPIVICLGLLFLLTGVSVLPAHAYPWSDKADLEITVNPQGVLFINAVDCKGGATLSGNGNKYYPTTTNPFGSNKCVFKVSKAYVGNGLTYTLSFKYTYLFTSSSKSVNVYVKRPALSTYKVTVNYKP